MLPFISSNGVRVMFRAQSAVSKSKPGGLPSLIYHEPVLEVRFMGGAVGTTRILTIRAFDILTPLATNQKAGSSNPPGRTTFSQ